MPVKPTFQQLSSEQLHQMAQQYGLHMSDADLAFFTRSSRMVRINWPWMLCTIAAR